jgi:multiple sugar transport system substrate-binding protein
LFRHDVSSKQFAGGCGKRFSRDECAPKGMGATRSELYSCSNRSENSSKLFPSSGYPVVDRTASEHVMDCYVIWNFAENKEGAKRFLVDYIDNFSEGFKAGKYYNFPCFPTTVSDLAQQIANDPTADPPDKYKVLTDVLDWATNIGYPGYCSAGIDEVFNTWVIPTMFAKVAKGEMSPEDSAKAAEAEIKRIFERRKAG